MVDIVYTPIVSALGPVYSRRYGPLHGLHASAATRLGRESVPHVLLRRARGRQCRPPQRAPREGHRRAYLGVCLFASLPRSYILGYVVVLFTRYAGVLFLEPSHLLALFHSLTVTVGSLCITDVLNLR